jgi:hypothetical protein
VGLVAVILAAVVVWAVIAIYRRERAATAERLRWACCALRVLCLGLLALILLRPSVARDVERELPGRVLLLADRSASMSVRDAHLDSDAVKKWNAALGLPTGQSVTNLSRHDVLRLLLRDRAGLIGSISRTSQVEVVTFAEEARTVLEVPRHRAGPETAETDAEAAVMPDWRPTGGTTDLGGALRGALEAPQAERLAGIVVLTDGRDTEGRDLQAVAREAMRRAVPVHFIGIGSPVTPRNLAVVEVFCSDHAIKGLPFEMRAFVRSSGYAGRSADLVLTATDAESGRSEEMLRRQVALGEAAGRQSLDLRHVPTMTGRLRYTARLEPLEGESRTDDNSAEAEVRVTEEKIRVFLAAGAPSREYRFLAALIGRDPAFDLTARLHSATAEGATPGALPRQREELLAYDAVVLCDPSPDGAPPEWLDIVAGAVDTEGLGFAFLAGPTYTPELLTDPALDRVRALLPVAVDPTRVRALIGGTGYFTESLPVRLGGGGRGHSITNPGPGVDVAGFWREAPGLYWILPASKAKPGATVLLLCRDPAARGDVILAATHSYGLGRVFYCGSPETWRWRRRGTRGYERFWLQALRYCAGGRLAALDRRARIILERSTYVLGELVGVRAAIRTGQPVDKRMELVVEGDGRRVGTVEMQPVAGETGAYEGMFYPDDFGRFEFVYTEPEGSRTATPFEVRPPDVELSDVRMDSETMRELAAKTGGRYLEPDQIVQIPGLIPDLTRTVVEEGPLEPVWDTPYLLVLLVGLLSAEWLARKRAGML